MNDRSRPEAASETLARSTGSVRRGTVRAVVVVTPCRDALDAADVFKAVGPEVGRVAVEITSGGFTPSGVTALAELAEDGVDVDVRGSNAHFVRLLVAEVEATLARGASS